MTMPVEWLLDGEPFVEYRARMDLLGQAADDPRVTAAREAMLADPRLRALGRGLSPWPGEVVASHRSAKQPFHRLTFLADLGVRDGDPGVGEVLSAVMRHQSDEGPFRLTMKISPHHGGSGVEVWAWALCDAPLLVYALAAMGRADEPAVRAAVDHLVALVRENGWPCAVSKELGGFRGPGRRADPCPYANLAMLKALSRFEDLRDGPAARTGTATLLDLWEHSRERHPYLFYMGTDFRKLKAPFVWYDLLHVLDVLSRFPHAMGDARLQDMLDVLWGKIDDDGRFAAESVWLPWKEWEFGQKRRPSRWITLLAWRIARRTGYAPTGG